MANKEFKGEKNISPIFDGREGLPITSEQDRMLEIKWAENWSANGQGWGEQVHGTYTAEVVDGFYQFKADNPDIPNWWFPRDFIDGQQLTQRAFVGWGVTQEDIDNLKEGFEKGIFDKEKNKKLLKVVNDLDGSSMLINVDTPTNVGEIKFNKVSESGYPERTKYNAQNISENQLDSIANKYNVDPKQLGGLLGRMGAGALDPVSEALEVALGKIGLGKVAKGWVQGEVLNLMAGALRGLAQGSGEYLAQTTGPAVMNLSAGRQVVQGSETPGVDALISGLEGFADQMEYSPSYIIDEKVKEKTGKYGGEHLRAAASRLGKTITK